MSKKKKKEKKDPKHRNSYVPAMLKRHAGGGLHKDKRKKRKNNPKRNWKSEWEID